MDKKVLEIIRDAELKGLTKLDLSGNQLTEIPEHITRLCVRHKSR